MAVTASQMAQHWRERDAARRERARLRAERLTRNLVDARRALVARGAERVWLFGSLATGQVHEGSDVDLAVAGLPTTAYFAALAELMQLFAGPVDLVRMEEAPDSLRERIDAEGREL